MSGTDMASRTSRCCPVLTARMLLLPGSSFGSVGSVRDRTSARYYCLPPPSSSLPYQLPGY
eukprot:1321618-Rhodomonas_salina.2